jgi:hypothetical protein
LADAGELRDQLVTVKIVENDDGETEITLTIFSLVNNGIDSTQEVPLTNFLIFTESMTSQIDIF